MNPVVSYLIVCEDLLVDITNPRRVSLVGLLSAIRSTDPVPFPLLYRELCVFVQLTTCRGPALGHIEIRHADTDRVIKRTSSRTLMLPNQPLDIVGMTFRIQDIEFPEAGLYWVQFWYNNTNLSQHPLLLRTP